MRFIHSIERKLLATRARNIILDKKTSQISDNELEKGLCTRIMKFDRSKEEFYKWQKDCKFEEFYGFSYPHKKALEFFYSTLLLEIKNEDIILDTAARIYSFRALRSRILNLFSRFNLEWTIITCTLDGNDIPDMNVNFGSKINQPLRAMLLEMK